MGLKDWVSADEPPELYPGNGPDMSSTHVLGYLEWGEIKVVVLEQWDEDDHPRWYTTCSEHWNLEDKVTHWMPLPKPPVGDNT